MGLVGFMGLMGFMGLVGFRPLAPWSPLNPSIPVFHFFSLFLCIHSLRARYISSLMPPFSLKLRFCHSIRPRWARRIGGWGWWLCWLSSRVNALLSFRGRWPNQGVLCRRHVSVRIVGHRMAIAGVRAHAGSLSSRATTRGVKHGSHSSV